MQRLKVISHEQVFSNLVSIGSIGVRMVENFREWILDHYKATCATLHDLPTPLFAQINFKIDDSWFYSLYLGT